MERAPVKSSNLVSVGYDPDENVLEIEFKGKKGNPVYRYAGVPRSVHEALMAAESKGGFVHARINGAYDHAKVR